MRVFYPGVVYVAVFLFSLRESTANPTIFSATCPFGIV